MPTVLTLVAVSVPRNLLSHEIGLPGARPGCSLQTNRFTRYFDEIVADELLVLKFLGEQPVASRADDLNGKTSQVLGFEIYPLRHSKRAVRSSF